MDPVAEEAVNAQITVSRTISMGHRLPSYRGICASPHGHNVRVEVTLYAGERFLDFKEASDYLGHVLADFDHAMVLAGTDPLLEGLRAFAFRTVALSVEPTTEALAQFVYNDMAASYTVLAVTVHETDKYSATVTGPDPNVRRL